MEDNLKNNELNEIKPKKKRYKWLLGIVIGVVLVLALVLSKKRVIDLNEFVSIEITGYNGYGMAEWSFDYGKFEKEYSDKLKYTKSFKKENGESWIPPCMFVQMILKGDVDKKEGLFNGDFVTFTWKKIDSKYLSDMFNYEFKFTPVSITVDELKEIERFDAFADICVEYYGCSPMAEVRIINNSMDEVMQELNYRVDNIDGLANGDTFRITVSAPTGKELNSYCAEKYGKIPLTAYEEYTVSDLDEYVTSIDQIPKDDLEKMKNQVVDHLYAQATKEYDKRVSIEGEHYLGAYVLSRKNGNYNTTNNYIYLIYNVKAYEDFSSQGVENHIDYYYYGMFSNVVMNARGECEVELANVSVCRDSFSRRLNVENGYWDYKTLEYRGYESLDRLLNDNIITKVDNYTYKSTVQDIK